MNELVHFQNKFAREFMIEPELQTGAKDFIPAFDLEDGRTISVPIVFYPTLMLARAEDRADYEICHSSVHWPKLDCDHEERRREAPAR